MPYSGLTSFIKKLEKNNEISRIKVFVDPVLEIAEITDRIVKSGAGKALLFENNGTSFPVLINSFGSDKRMAMAMGRENPDEAGMEIDKLFDTFSSTRGNLLKKLSSIPDLIKLTGILPSYNRKRGSSQEVIHKDPDLGILPILKCWPYDGGRFITLPMVHTIHPETGKSNVGMYRIQVLDKNTAAMHWQRHKTGANHFEAWKKTGRKMPVAVALGGDPVYTYCATAPLPENIDEYILAGFLRKKKVRMVKCLTNVLYVPSDADIIIEGYVDPAEENVWEGPFGDHTGFYSLADWYPKFHITCITHSERAIYPATIVGIPPQEDAWFAKTTEKLFLAPIRIAIQPEITDFHLPDAGIAHNLVVVKINKSYPGQGMKVINSLFGAGQMMFTKYVVVVSGSVDIRNYKELVRHIFLNFNFSKDIFFSHGPLDVLDHSSDNYSFGGKAGLDATVKHPEENSGRIVSEVEVKPSFDKIIQELKGNKLFQDTNSEFFEDCIPILIVSVNLAADNNVITKVENLLRKNDPDGVIKMMLVVDHTVNIRDIFMVTWQILGNSDPFRDHKFISPHSILIDGTVKAFRKGGFTRKWPNVVCSGIDTILAIDQKWDSLGLGTCIDSPSRKYRILCRNGKDEILVDEI